jgi:hypothetical protein
MNIKVEEADSKAFRGGSATDEAHAHHDIHATRLTAPRDVASSHSRSNADSRRLRKVLHNMNRFLLYFYQSPDPSHFRLGASLREALIIHTTELCSF